MNQNSTLLKQTSLLFAGLLLLAGIPLRAQSSADLVAKPDVRPVPLRTVAPVAPQGQTGLVAVSFIVDEHGRVVDATVAKSTNATLEKPALAAIEAWTFRPAMKDGKPVRVKVTVPVRFEENS